ncbi:IS110 family transposase [Rhodobacteraceae bacterium]|nr:IS110 family transposase [Paracoccaceae bacterium]
MPLFRGGDRQANAAVYRATLVRMRHHEQTRAYARKSLQEEKGDQSLPETRHHP